MNGKLFVLSAATLALSAAAETRGRLAINGNDRAILRLMGFRLADFMEAAESNDMMEMDDIITEAIANGDRMRGNARRRVA